MKLLFRSATLCCTLLIVMMNVPVNAASAAVFEFYDNEKIIYGYLDDGVTYIPIGDVWRQFGMELFVDAREKKISFSTEQGAVTLGFRFEHGEINGVPVELTRPVRTMQNKVYVPVRDAAQLFGITFNVIDTSKLELARGAKKLLIQIKPITSAYLYQPKKIDVIMYHHFDPDISDSVTVTPDRFHEHLDALLQAGYETITEEDLYQFKTNPDYRLPKKPLLITIDDGYESNYTIAYPILKDKGFRATIYVVTSSRGKMPGIKQHFSWEAAKEMYDSGVINIESHTHNLHHYVTQGKHTKAAMLARLEDEDETAYRKRILADLVTSRDLIRQHIGKESIALSYPYGRYDTTALKLAEEAGFKLHITLRTDTNLRGGNLLISRINADGRLSGEQLLRKLKS